MPIVATIAGKVATVSCGSGGPLLCEATLTLIDETATTGPAQVTINDYSDIAGNQGAPYSSAQNDDQNATSVSVSFAKPQVQSLSIAVTSLDDEGLSSGNSGRRQNRRRLSSELTDYAKAGAEIRREPGVRAQMPQSRPQSG